MAKQLRVPLEITEPITGAETAPGLRVPLETTEALTTGLSPGLRVPLEVGEPLTGGVPRERVCLVVCEVLEPIPPDGYMTTRVFPTLRGLTWSVHKKPIFSTRVARQQSGREIRLADYPYPLWEFDLSYDYLPNITEAQATTDLQTLMGFFLASQGMFGQFLFHDPSDYRVTGQLQATADGTTLQWPFARVMGEFTEPVGQIDQSALCQFFHTDVHPTTDEITITGHGLTTGVQPMFLTGTATLPAPLNNHTPYWPIVVDANTIKLAVNSVQALAGNAIDITAAGTSLCTLSKAWVVYATIQETHTVPAGPTPTITVTNAATFVDDVSVLDNTTSIPMTRTTGSPIAGQYQVNTATGVYTFNTAQSGDSVTITYTYMLATPSVVTLLSPNQMVFGVAPAAGTLLTADFDFYFQCRFLEDSQDYENFVDKLWQLQKCDLMSVIP